MRRISATDFFRSGTPSEADQVCVCIQYLLEPKLQGKRAEPTGFSLFPSVDASAVRVLFQSHCRLGGALCRILALLDRGTVLRPQKAVGTVWRGHCLICLISPRRQSAREALGRDALPTVGRVQHTLSNEAPYRCLSCVRSSTFPPL